MLGSFIGKFTRPISLGLAMPRWMRSKTFQLFLFCVMMGAFLLLLAWAIPQGVYMVGRVVVFFMVRAAAVGFIAGVVFKPRSWCAVCPMGYASGHIRDYMIRRGEKSATSIKAKEPSSRPVYFFM